ncbi:MAG: hypothetical protein ACYTEG_08915 [Planctomycetota bacterium]|jgi:hypothetical protein
MRALAVLLLIVVPSWGERLPSFWLDTLAWRATHIVVATEGESIDGKLTVTDCLAGVVKTHTNLELPGLARFATDRSRTIHDGFRATSERVDGSSMVLFLMDDGNRFKGAAEYGGIEVSTAWIKKDKAYAFVQGITLGPQVMTEVGTKQAMLARIGVIRGERKKLEAAQALPDAAQRAAAVALRIDSFVPVARSAAVVALGDCGPEAMPVIDRLLADPKRTPYHGMLVKQLARAGGAAAAPRLTRQLERDLRYWTETGPTLSKGWWNGRNLEPKRRMLLQQQYSRTLETLRALKKLKHRAAAPTAQRLADFWRSLPQLHDKSGLDQMTDAAEAVAHLAD